MAGPIIPPPPLGPQKVLVYLDQMIGRSLAQGSLCYLAFERIHEAPMGQPPDLLTSILLMAIVAIAGLDRVLPRLWAQMHGAKPDDAPSP
jgi:uncharacterized membrane protein